MEIESCSHCCLFLGLQIGSSCFLGVGVLILVSLARVSVSECSTSVSANFNLFRQDELVGKKTSDSTSRIRIVNSSLS